MANDNNAARPQAQEIPGVLEIDYARGVIYFHAAEPTEQVLPTPLRVQGVEFSRFEGSLIDLNAATTPTPAAGSAEPPLSLKEKIRNYRHKLTETVTAEAESIHDVLSLLMNTDPDWSEWDDLAAAGRLVEEITKIGATIEFHRGCKILVGNGDGWMAYVDGMECVADGTDLAAALTALTGRAGRRAMGKDPLSWHSESRINSKEDCDSFADYVKASGYSCKVQEYWPGKWACYVDCKPREFERLVDEWSAE